MNSLKQKLEEARELVGNINIPKSIEFEPEHDDRKIRAAAVSVLDSILADLSRPFDPTECGFEHTESGGILNRQQWANGMQAITLDGGYGLIEEIGGSSQWEFPWPANQFDGVRLLLSLGVIKEGEG